MPTRSVRPFGGAHPLDMFATRLALTPGAPLLRVDYWRFRMQPGMPVDHDEPSLALMAYWSMCDVLRAMLLSSRILSDEEHSHRAWMCRTLDAYPRCVLSAEATDRLRRAYGDRIVGGHLVHQAWIADGHTVEFASHLDAALALDRFSPFLARFQDAEPKLSPEQRIAAALWRNTPCILH